MLAARSKSFSVLLEKWWLILRRHRSGSTCPVNGLFLMAPSHYLSQTWLIIIETRWHLAKGSFTETDRDIVWELHIWLLFHGPVSWVFIIVEIYTPCIHVIVPPVSEFSEDPEEKPPVVLIIILIMGGSLFFSMACSFGIEHCHSRKCVWKCLIK